MVQPLFFYHGATDSPSLAPLARHSDALGFGWGMLGDAGGISGEGQCWQGEGEYSQALPQAPTGLSPA